MADCAEHIVVIPSIADPRNTITSIAAFQNAFDIDPPMPIVVIYGTCPDSFNALGEGGARLRNWRPPWEPDRLNEVTERFRQIAENNGIPVYFFDVRAQRTVWDRLNNASSSAQTQLPEGVSPEAFKRCIDAIFGATYSYGAQRNKAFIIANNLQARSVFFFDDDTFLAPHVGNMIERHLRLLERANVYAVTGGYFGQRAFNATIFRKIEQQQEFMGLLGYEIPDDQATQDLWGWRIADGVLGGNFCLKKPVYERICCPAMHRTPTTDDKLIGREIRRVFGRQAHVYKTGWPVVHVHFPHRMEPRQVDPYLRSWAKTKAFWALYDKVQGDFSFKDGTDQNAAAEAISCALETVLDFGRSLEDLGQVEMDTAGGQLASAIRSAADAIVKGAQLIVDSVVKEVGQFEALKRSWETILRVTGTMEIFEEENRFTPNWRREVTEGGVGGGSG